MEDPRRPTMLDGGPATGDDANLTDEGTNLFPERAYWNGGETVKWKKGTTKLINFVFNFLKIFYYYYYYSWVIYYLARVLIDSIINFFYN